MTAGHLIVVDTETNGLDYTNHQAVEVAWWNLSTEERGLFVPQHNWRMVLHDADLAALRINKYLDRIVDRIPTERVLELEELYRQLTDATLVGANPAFDAAMLTKMFRSNLHQTRPASWHHRLWDVSAYAAGVLGLDKLPGLAALCRQLDIEPGDHSAEADVTATGLCFRELRRRAGAR